MRRHFYGFISAFSISLIITVSGFAVQNSGIKEGRNPAAHMTAPPDPLAAADLANTGHKRLGQNRNSLSAAKSVSAGKVRENTLANGRIQGLRI